MAASGSARGGGPPSRPVPARPLPAFPPAELASKQPLRRKEVNYEHVYSRTAASAPPAAPQAPPAALSRVGSPHGCPAAAPAPPPRPATAAKRPPEREWRAQSSAESLRSVASNESAAASESMLAVCRAEIETLRAQVAELRQQRDGWEQRCRTLDEQRRQLDADAAALQLESDAKVARMEAAHTEMCSELARSLRETVEQQRALEEQLLAAGLVPAQRRLASDSSASADTPAPAFAQRTARIDRLLSKLKVTTRDLGSLLNVPSETDLSVVESRTNSSLASRQSSATTPYFHAASAAASAPASAAASDAAADDAHLLHSREILRASLRKRSLQQAAAAPIVVVPKGDSGADLSADGPFAPATAAAEKPRDEWATSLISIMGNYGF